MDYEHVIILNSLRGKGILAFALGQAIEYWFGYSSSVLDSEADLQYLLELDQEFTKSPVVLLTSMKGDSLDQQVFNLNCALRRRSLDGESKWIGGLIVVPQSKGATEMLLGNPIYKNLSGHAVVSFPTLLLELLSAIDRVGELYPGAWALAAEKTGLGSFWQLVDMASRNLANGDVAAALNKLKEAISKVMDNGILKRLLPHAEVIRQIESLGREIDQLDCPSTTNISMKLVRLGELMADYKMGD
jgi:hypothetical protein